MHPANYRLRAYPEVSALPSAMLKHMFRDEANWLELVHRHWYYELISGPWLWQETQPGVAPPREYLDNRGWEYIRYLLREQETWSLFMTW